MKVKFFLSFFPFFAAALLLGFLTATLPAEAASEGAPPLRVGITPVFPPLVFKQAGQLAGIEVELARMLGEELGRPVQFVEVKWDKQIPALLDGKTDIIMSSMTATRERQVRIAFTEPLMKNSLVAAVRAEDVWKYPTREKVMDCMDLVGFIPETTSEAFVQRNMPYAQQHHVANLREAADALKNRWISMYIGDAPSVIWLVSENESTIAGIWLPLNEDNIAWGLRKADSNLLARVNIALAQFRQDGRLEMVLHKWLPKQYLEKMK
jgi:polar amino acid transport system substrate-binding protein